MTDPLATPTPEASPPAMSEAAPAPTPAAIPVVTQTQATQISPATPAQEKLSEIRQTEVERITQGQRKVNLIWEITQATIAVAVVIAATITAVLLVIRGDAESRQQGLALLTAAFFLVIGQYFTRTNHTKTGGPGGADVARDR